MRRLVEFSAGWAPMIGELPALAEAIKAAKQALEAEGRDISGFEFSFGLSFGEADQTIDASLHHVAGERITVMVGQAFCASWWQWFSGLSLLPTAVAHADGVENLMVPSAAMGRDIPVGFQGGGFQCRPSRRFSVTSDSVPLATVAVI